jgi:hypothetical protein
MLFTATQYPQDGGAPPVPKRFVEQYTRKRLVRRAVQKELRSPRYACAGNSGHDTGCEEVFCEFELDRFMFEVREPFEDNSRYWIGPEPARWIPPTRSFALRSWSHGECRLANSRRCPAQAISESRTKSGALDKRILRAASCVDAPAEVVRRADRALSPLRLPIGRLAALTAKRRQ